MQIQYIETGQTTTIVQDMPTSQSTDDVRIQIIRESDGYYWDFFNLVFISTSTPNTSGVMTYINGSWWKSSFMPAADGIYLVLVDDKTLDSQNTQILTAVTSVTPAPTPIPSPVPPSNIQELIDNAERFMPARFIAQVDDDKVVAYLDIVLSDINAVSPVTGYTLDNMPTSWINIVCFGASLYATLFLIANYTLQDFSYSDNGLSLNVDRTAKLSPLYDKYLANYEKMKINLKKAVAISTGPKVLATNQYFSVVQQFMSQIFPGTVSHQ